ncbi:unnamed protein product [Amoebophrya sp. A25]|nr:unnamed protein product [Amoebophrya sp. A25]|eukprot:GSA25T00012516001.1
MRPCALLCCGVGSHYVPANEEERRMLSPTGVVSDAGMVEDVARRTTSSPDRSSAFTATTIASPQRCQVDGEGRHTCLHPNVCLVPGRELFFMMDGLAMTTARTTTALDEQKVSSSSSKSGGAELVVDPSGSRKTEAEPSETLSTSLESEPLFGCPSFSYGQPSALHLWHQMFPFDFPCGFTWPNSWREYSRSYGLRIPEKITADGNHIRAFRGKSLIVGLPDTGEPPTIWHFIQHLFGIVGAKALYKVSKWTSVLVSDPAGWLSRPHSQLCRYFRRLFELMVGQRLATDLPHFRYIGPSAQLSEHTVAGVGLRLRTEEEEQDQMNHVTPHSTTDDSANTKNAGHDNSAETMSRDDELLRMFQHGNSGKTTSKALIAQGKTNCFEEAVYTGWTPTGVSGTREMHFFRDHMKRLYPHIKQRRYHVLYLSRNPETVARVKERYRKKAAGSRAGRQHRREPCSPARERNIGATERTERVRGTEADEVNLSADLALPSYIVRDSLYKDRSFIPLNTGEQEESKGVVEDLHERDVGEGRTRNCDPQEQDRQEENTLHSQEQRKEATTVETEATKPSSILRSNDNDDNDSFDRKQRAASGILFNLGRTLLNEEAFVSAVQSRIFRFFREARFVSNASPYLRVHTGAEPFETQMKLFAEAALVIGTFASGLSNLLFLPPGAHLLILNLPGHMQSQQFLATNAGLSHHNFFLDIDDGIECEDGGNPDFDLPHLRSPSDHIKFNVGIPPWRSDFPLRNLSGGHFASIKGPAAHLQWRCSYRVNIRRFLPEFERYFGEAFSFVKRRRVLASENLESYLLDNHNSSRATVSGPRSDEDEERKKFELAAAFVRERKMPLDRTAHELRVETVKHLQERVEARFDAANYIMPTSSSS